MLPDFCAVTLLYASVLGLVNLIKFIVLADEFVKEAQSKRKEVASYHNNQRSYPLYPLG